MLLNWAQILIACRYYQLGPVVDLGFVPVAGTAKLSKYPARRGGARSWHAASTQ